MSNPNEVKVQRYHDYGASTGCVPCADGNYVKYSDHAKALSAEREMAEKRVESNRLYGYRDGMKESEEKIEALESKLKEAKVYVYEGSDNEADLLNKQHHKITALEAKVKELEKRKRGFSWHDMQFRIKCAIDNQPRTKGIISRLESSLLAANAKIVELEKENRKIRDDLLVSEDELERIRKVAERLRDSDDENEISLEENIAGKYMIKVLDGENFS